MTRSVLAFVVGLPGAVVVGFYGHLVAQFAGDASPNDFAMVCYSFWGGFGGASLGAAPGITLGLFLRLRWVFPFLGAAGGALVSLLFELTHVGPGDVNVQGPLYAGLVLSGLLVGSSVWIVRYRRDRPPGKQKGSGVDSG